MLKKNLLMVAALFFLQAFILIGCGSPVSNPSLQTGGQGGSSGGSGNLDGRYLISSWTCGPRDILATLIGGGVKSVKVLIIESAGSSEIEYTNSCKRRQLFSVSYPDSQTAVLSDAAPTCSSGCESYCTNKATPTSTYTFVRSSSLTTTRVLSESDISQNSALTAAHCVVGDLETRLLIEDVLPSSTPIPAPPPLSLGTPTVITAGSDTSCGIFAGALYCWGDNSEGTLGNGLNERSKIPVQVQGFTSGVTAVSISTSSFGNHACAIKNGAAWCWGQNGNGELGDNSYHDSLVPVQVQGLSSGVTSISTGDDYTCAVVNGAALCWGRNASGQLGNGSYLNSGIPVQVQGLTSGVTQISAGGRSTCAIVNGAAKCWGNDIDDQLGDGGATVDPRIPNQVQGLTSGVSAISQSGNGACAIKNGSALCWGRGESGQLGNGFTTAQTSVPVQVLGLTSGVTAISAGEQHSCAIVLGKSLCWGKNFYGNLGNGITSNSSVPAQVSGLTSGTLSLSAGQNHSCAVASGSAVCWGSNGYGQIGDGTTSTRYSPFKVLGSP